MGSHRSGWYTMVLVTACAIAFGACKKTEPGAHTGSHTAPTTAPAADSHAPSTAGHAPSAAGAAPHWEYEGMAGPTAWGALSPEFATCSAGLQQSPIDIPGASPAVTAEQRAAFPLGGGREPCLGAAGERGAQRSHDPGRFPERRHVDRRRSAVRARAVPLPCSERAHLRRTPSADGDPLRPPLRGGETGGARRARRAGRAERRRSDRSIPRCRRRRDPRASSTCSR